MIGWYVHHHGSGHLTRMRAVSTHLDQDVVVFSSLQRPSDWSGEWVQLPLDLPVDPDDDPTVRGAVHWSPLSSAGYAQRMRTIAAWVADAAPAAFVVDVSVEVTALVRLLGVPAATVLMPGERTDRPHRLGHDLADLLIGPWPAGAHVVDESVAARLVAVGGISRFAGRPPSQDPVVRRRVLVLCGGGGSDLDPDQLAAAQRAVGGEWLVRGGAWPASEDLWSDLQHAETVVTFAGQNAIADVATARRPAVVIAADRPYGEQLATAKALRRNDIAVTLDGWPDPDEWPGLLDRARSIGGNRWTSWTVGGGAAAAARAIERLAACRR